ncbi:unnamed protein product, partial [Pleuronectes platessa]
MIQPDRCADSQCFVAISHAHCERNMSGSRRSSKKSDEWELRAKVTHLTDACTHKLEDSSCVKSSKPRSIPTALQRDAVQVRSQSKRSKKKKGVFQRTENPLVGLKSRGASIIPCMHANKRRERRRGEEERRRGEILLTLEPVYQEFLCSSTARTPRLCHSLILLSSEQRVSSGRGEREWKLLLFIN